MSTQKPDPYGIDADGDSLEDLGGVETFIRQDEINDRARSTKMDAIALDPGRTCVNCGYDLTGLFAGGNCPECGDKILSVAPTPDIAALNRLPLWYLRTLGAVLGIMTVFGCFGIVFAIYGWTLSNAVTPSPGIVFSIYQAASLAWLASVVFVCIPPPENEPVLGIGRSRSELTLAATVVVSQLGFVISSFHVYVLSNPHPGWLVWSALVSYCGMVLVGLQLAKIAWRLNDEDRAHRLQSAALSIPFGYALTVVFGRIIGAQVQLLSLFGVVFLFIQAVGIALQAWGCVYLVWSMWSLSGDAGWAIRNARAHEARTERLKKRTRENFEQAQAEREAKAPFGGPLQ